MEKEYIVEFSIFDALFRTKIIAKDQNEANEKLLKFIQQKIDVKKITRSASTFNQASDLLDDIFTNIS